jgi:predicted transcriptional regulator
VNNQAEVAKQLNITQQAISNALQQIDAFKIIQLEKNICEWLQTYKGKNA